MPDKKKNSQVVDKKDGAGRQPPQVAPAEKHLGATADEDIPQDDPRLTGKGKAGNKQQVAHQRAGSKV